MSFLPRVHVPCERCGGRRFNEDTLRVRYRGQSVADVLQATVTQARDLLGAVPALRRSLDLLCDVGLDYLQLGQPSTTLSGGETFLASLALALALAEGLSGMSSGHTKFALESLFLDEGFGTLDPETLETVVGGIEGLSASNRLIGIISHIPDLAERMPIRIEVRKSVGGSTIQVS